MKIQLQFPKLIWYLNTSYVSKILLLFLINIFTFQQHPISNVQILFFQFPVLLVPPKTGLIRQSPVAIFPYSQPITTDSLNQPRMISPHIIYPILARLRQRISMPNAHPETALPSQPTGPLPTGLLPDTDQITPTSTPNSAQATLINSNEANNEQTASSLSLDPNNTSTSTANQPKSSTSATLTTTVAANETTTLRSNPGTNNSSFEGPIGMFKRSVAEKRIARNVGGKSGTRKAAVKATQERLRPRRLPTAQRKLLLSKWGAAKHAQLKNTRAIFSPTEKWPKHYLNSEP